MSRLALLRLLVGAGCLGRPGWSVGFRGLSLWLRLGLCRVLLPLLWILFLLVSWCGWWVVCPVGSCWHDYCFPVGLCEGRGECSESSTTRLWPAASVGSPFSEGRVAASHTPAARFEAVSWRPKPRMRPMTALRPSIMLPVGSLGLPRSTTPRRLAWLGGPRLGVGGRGARGSSWLGSWRSWLGGLPPRRPRGAAGG